MERIGPVTFFGTTGEYQNRRSLPSLSGPQQLGLYVIAYDALKDREEQAQFYVPREVRESLEGIEGVEVLFAGKMQKVVAQIPSSKVEDVESLDCVVNLYSVDLND